VGTAPPEEHLVVADVDLRVEHDLADGADALRRLDEDLVAVDALARLGRARGIADRHDGVPSASLLGPASRRESARPSEPTHCADDEDFWMQNGAPRVRRPVRPPP